MKINFLLSLFVLVLITACSSTSSRKDQYPPEFYDFTPTEQSIIRRGEIAVGFNEKKVRMALGNPDRIRKNTGRSEYSWEYNRLITNTGFIQRVGASVARGSDPIIASTQGNPVSSRPDMRVYFSVETRTVTRFQSF